MNLQKLKEIIPGIWYDKNYSFAFGENGSLNNVSYTNKKIFPKNAVQGKFWIREKIIEIILFYGETPINKMVLIIENFNSTNIKVRSLNNDLVILTKVA